MSTRYENPEYIARCELLNERWDKLNKLPMLELARYINCSDPVYSGLASRNLAKRRSDFSSDLRRFVLGGISYYFVKQWEIEHTVDRALRTAWGKTSDIERFIKIKETQRHMLASCSTNNQRFGIM